MIPVKIPMEHKAELIREVQTYFETERDVTLGDLAAEQVIDFMLGQLAPFVYNQAVADARSALQEKMSQMEDELYALERPVARR